MCTFDPTAARAVVEDVRRRIRHREMFTALDVSRAVQESGLAMPHRFVRRLVHALYEQDQMGARYTRTPVCVEESRTAWVYHEHGVSAHIYASARFWTERFLANPEP